MTPLLLSHALRAVVALVRAIGRGWRWCLRQVGIDAPDPPVDEAGHRWWEI
jgi:hypothetical protein